MSIIITRHMESRHNVSEPGKPETFAGNRVDCPLTERGIADARHVAEKIVELGGVDAILTSPMLRTRQTGQVLADEISRITGQAVRVEALPGLEEVDAGDFTGLTRDEAAKIDDALLHIFVDRVLGEGAIKELKFPGGDDYSSVTARLRPALAIAQSRSGGGERVLLVSHANTIKIMHTLLSEEMGAKIAGHRLDMTELTGASRTDGIADYRIDVASWNKDTRADNPEKDA